MRWAVYAGFGLAVTGAPLAPAVAATYQTLCHFNNKGTGGYPESGLAVGTDGTLYGTTVQGGTKTHGTAFACDPATHAVTILHDFAKTADGSPTFQGLAIGPDGTLYGTTLYGGAKRMGSIYAIDPATKKLTTIFSFAATKRGISPVAGMMFDGALLYGTTGTGGTHGYGTIFGFDPATHKQVVVHSFTGGADGALPWTPLAMDASGALYGMAISGGANGLGTVYKFVPATKKLTTVYAFTSADGTLASTATLAITSAGMIYGTTDSGGTGSHGEIFAVDPATKTGGAVYSFTNGADGGFPAGGLVVGPGGVLYGTTYLGGAGSSGTLYSFDPASASVTTLESFTDCYKCAGGFFPLGWLVTSGDALYGTTEAGGVGSYGTVFRYTP